MNKLLILYASQTGNSQDVAETIANEAHNYDILTYYMALDEYEKVNLIHENLVVFVCSTTGQGDEPDNMKVFWKFLLKKCLPSNSLVKLKFAVLGLGDSSYTKYNYVAKRLNKRLLQLGASPLIPLTLVDEQSPSGPDAIIEAWLNKMWHAVFLHLGMPISAIESEVYLKPMLKYQITPGEPTQEGEQPKDLANSNISPPPYNYATLDENIRVTPLDHFQDTRLLTLDIKDFKMNEYQPFDIVMVQPPNREETVTEFIEFYKLNPNQPINVSLIQSGKGVMGGDNILHKMPHLIDLSSKDLLTIVDVVSKLLDLQSVPRRSFFRYLAYYSNLSHLQVSSYIASYLKSFETNAGGVKPANVSGNRLAARAKIKETVSRLISGCIASEREFVTLNLDEVSRSNEFRIVIFEYKRRLEAEKERLRELCAPTNSGREELYSYCNRVRRNIAEVLYDFPATSRTIPISHLLSMIQQIQPRPFSIANARNYMYPRGLNFKEDPTCQKIQILVAVVEYKTKLYKPRRGTCSYWLSTLLTGTKIPIYIKPGYVQLPPFLLNKDISQISPEDAKPVILVGPGTGVAPLRALIQKRISLSIDGNYLFFGCRSESKDHYFADEFKEYHSRGLLKCYNAFSRDQPNRAYVQHTIKQESLLIYQLLINKDASVYVSGRAKNMPDEVVEALGYSLKTHGDFNAESAKAFIDKLISLKRIQMETWS